MDYGGIDQGFIESFSDIVTYQLQQKESKLLPYVMQQTGDGKIFQLNVEFPKVQTEPVIGRNQEVVYQDYSMGSRWVYPDAEKDARIISHADVLKMKINMAAAAPLVNSIVMAFNRAIDKRIVEAALGSANIGINGTSTVALPSSQIIPIATGASAATGMNVEKIKEAAAKLDDASVPYEDRVLAMTPKQFSELLNEVQTTNNLYNGTYPLVSNDLPHFLGFDIVRIPSVDNILPISGTTRTCLAFQKSRMFHVPWGSGLMVDYIAKLPYNGDYGLSSGLYISMMWGATRTAEEAVVGIPCVEA